MSTTPEKMLMVGIPHERRHVRGSRVIADEYVHSCESKWYVGDVKLADGVDALIRRQCRRERRGVRLSASPPIKINRHPASLFNARALGKIAPRPIA